MRLAIYLLGPPRVERDGVALTLERRKAIALLAYLALGERAYSRDALATLLWPGYDQATARGNLRRTLSVLTRTLDGEWIDADRELIGLAPSKELWIDVAHFRRSLAACRTHGHAEDAVCPACAEPLAAAAAIYVDDFLAGFTLPEAPEFDDWQVFQTESLRREFAGALKRLALCYARQGQPEAGLDVARRWLALDPLHESAHRMLMRLYAWTGDRAAALRQYAECSRLLATELALSPSAETDELYQAIVHDCLPAPEQFPTPVVPVGQATNSSALAETPPQALAHTASSGDLRLVTVVCAGLSLSLEPVADSRPEELAGQAERLVTLLEQALSRYGASVERFLGDGVVAVFGLEQIHEDDCERAVLAALEARNVANDARLPLSAGIQTGLIYASREGGRPTALGPVVNLAARLRDQAAGGEILLGETTYRQTHLAVRGERRTVSIPGLSQPASVYRVLRLRRQPRKSRGVEGLQVELVGRGEELSRLRGAVDALLTGQGGVISLSGDAGLGKSRLLAEAREYAAGHASISWLEGRCLEMTRSTAYAPFIDLSRAYFALQVEAGADLAPCVRAELDELTAHGQLTPDQCEEVGPLLGNLLGLHYGDDWDERLRMADPKQIQFRTFVAVRDLLAALARRRPLVVALEDLHWADTLSLDLVAELMPLVQQTPLLLCCVFRPTPDHRSRQIPTLAARRCPGRQMEINLHRLPAGPMRRLVNALLGAVLEERALDQIETRVQGNPFFAEEMVRALVETGALVKDGATWRAHGAAQPANLPATVQSVVLSRYDRLTSAHKEVLRQAAVIGSAFPFAVLAQLAQRTDLTTALDTLEEHGLVYRVRSLPEPDYSFWHVLIQEAIYATLPRLERARLHAQVARAVEALYIDSLPDHYEQLAYHYDRSDDADKAIDYLLRAGEKSRRAYLGEDSARYIERALRRLDELEQKPPQPALAARRQHLRYQALKQMGQVQYHLGNLIEAESSFREALEVGRQIPLSIEELALLYNWLCEALVWQGKPAEAVMFAQEGLCMLDQDTESAGAAMLNTLIAFASSFMTDDIETSRSYNFRTAQFVARLPYIEELRPTYHHIVEEYVWVKSPRLAEKWLEDLRRHAEYHHDLHALAETLQLAGMLVEYQGDFHGAIPHTQAAIELFDKMGNAKQAYAVRLELASCWLNLGELERSWQLVEFVLLSSTVTQVEPYLPHLLAGLLYLSSGEHEAAEQVLLATLARWPEAHVSAQIDIHIALGRIAHLRQQPDVAAMRFEQAVTLSLPLQPVQHDNNEVMWQTPLLVALAGLELACAEPAAFHSHCADYRSKQPDAAGGTFTHWHLEPADIWSPAEHAEQSSTFAIAQSIEDAQSGWVWCDPLGDCAYLIQDGLELTAANCRHLWFTNQSAPRLVQPTGGDFAVQTVCVPARDDRPTVGGLVLWRDEQNYLRLDRGLRGPQEIAFEGCVANRDVIIGRGLLREAGDRIWLRLEREGNLVRALCSADGAGWYTAGEVEFPMDDPVQAGMHALGYINRITYPGAYPEGTAIRFESWQLWQAAGTSLTT